MSHVKYVLKTALAESDRSIEYHKKRLIDWQEKLALAKRGVEAESEMIAAEEDKRAELVDALALAKPNNASKK